MNIPEAGPPLPMIVEHLDDGRIRYQSRDHGIVTGRQVGLVAIRDTTLSYPHQMICYMCGEPITHAGSDLHLVDLLERPWPHVATLTEQGALVFADEAWRPFDDAFKAWCCAQALREFNGETWLTFNQWRRGEGYAA